MPDDLFTCGASHKRVFLAHPACRERNNRQDRFYDGIAGEIWGIVNVAWRGLVATMTNDDGRFPRGLYLK